MSYDHDPLSDAANDAAIKGNFPLAIQLNTELVAKNSDDLDAYLRLGFAYLQIDDLENSKKSYRKALKIEPMNQIARNNLEKIQILEKKSEDSKRGSKKTFVIDPNLFLNIPGKTKEVTLVNIGQADVLADLKVGSEVFFKIKKRRVEIRNNKDKHYIGALPDDISKRLMFFLDASSQYHIYIKSTAKNNVDVFIREEKKGRKVKNYTSFPKNIQDDLKSMMSAEGDEEGEANEEEGEGESHNDLEKLADEVDTVEFIPETETEGYEEEEE